jgi:DNA-binding NtrC family response regulator
MAAKQTDYKQKLKEAVEKAQRTVITECILECKYNKADAARRLGMDRVTLYSRLEKLGIEL